MSKLLRFSVPFVVAVLMLGTVFVISAESSQAVTGEMTQSVYTVCPDGPPACDFSVIQEAVDAATTGDVIQIAEGVYTQINHYVGLAQIVYLNKTITLKGGYTIPFTDPPDPVAHPTVLDAQGEGRVFYIEYAAPTLDGLVITGGDSTGLSGTPYGDDAGGGVYMIDSQPVVQNSTVTGNISPWDGGGIYNIYSNSTILRTTVSYNQARYGGGIYVWYSNPLIMENLIADNYATSTGGGVWLGVYSLGMFSHNLFSGNSDSLDTYDGAGGMLGERCSLTFDGNIFSHNDTPAGGSGLSLIRCDATLTNNIFTDNHIEEVGGSLYLRGTTATLLHNTFAGTTGTTPSGIYLESDPQPLNSQATLVDTIIVSETTGIYVEVNNAADLQATLWGAGDWANDYDWAGPGEIITGTINLWGEPAFVDPGSGDYHITSSSPAVDAGTDAGVTMDIDGQPRPNGAAMDMGADEYWGGNLIVTTLDDELNGDGDCSLREAIEAANTNAPIDACGSGDVLTDTITFNVAGIITVTSQLSVTAGGPLVIDGGEVITTSGGGTTRVWWVESNSHLTIQNLNIVHGYIVGYGGGISNNGVLTIINSTFYANDIDFGCGEYGCFGGGGGIYNNGIIMVTNSTFSGNNCIYPYTVNYASTENTTIPIHGDMPQPPGPMGGGGISTSYNSTTNITNSTFYANDAYYGGAIFNWGFSTVTNSTLSGNSANGAGGGLFNRNSIITVTNTIVANSSSGGDCSGGTIDGGHNISSDDTCGFDPANGSMPNTDPLLGPLQDNGGPTWTHALLPGSPAIDAGDDTQCPPTDQRDVPRPIDGDGDDVAICDIGSFEFEQGITLQPLNQSGSGAPEASVEYTLELYNFTSLTDTYTLSLSAYAWDTALSTDLIGPLSPGISQSFTASVTIPADAPWFLTDTVVVTATSVTSPTVYSATAQVTTKAYAPPEISISPTFLSSMQYANEVTTQTLTISNGLGVTLTFDILNTIPGSVLLLHLDEPEGVTTFYDTSGYGNNGACSGDSCPQAGVGGIFGSAVQFDGMNDYIAVPHNDQFDQLEDQDRFTIAAWVNIENLNQGWFAVLDQYESTDDGGWEFTLYNSGIGGCDFPFTFGEWFHVVGVFDLGLGYRAFYFNGELFCHIAGGIDFPDTSGEPAYIGFSPTGPDEYAAGLLDEIYVFDQALSPEEVMVIYAGGWFGEVPWLSVDPTSGSVPPNSALPVQVTFDASDLQPDIYTATLYISSNDPLNPSVQIPVTMTVTGEVTPTAVTIIGVEHGWVGKEYAFTATVSPESAGIPLTYFWQADEQAPITHTTGITDTVSFAWDTPGMKVITVTSSNAYGEVMDTHLIDIVEPAYRFYLPLLQKEGQFEGVSRPGGMVFSRVPTGMIVVIALVPLLLLHRRSS